MDQPALRTYTLRMEYVICYAPWDFSTSDNAALIQWGIEQVAERHGIDGSKMDVEIDDSAWLLIFKDK